MRPRRTTRYSSSPIAKSTNAATTVSMATAANTETLSSVAANLSVMHPRVTDNAMKGNT